MYNVRLPNTSMAKKASPMQDKRCRINSSEQLLRMLRQRGHHFTFISQRDEMSTDAIRCPYPRSSMNKAQARMQKPHLTNASIQDAHIWCWCRNSRTLASRISGFSQVFEAIENGKSMESLSYKKPFNPRSTRDYSSVASRNR